ncbi:MAG: hypothetical protein CM1200mP14_27570 [Gammaproteobacteria bacterium]|nr:MAG: hypothetical protein CM1200mP14_27570 [Gammaproteobacteria bacterium]
MHTGFIAPIRNFARDIGVPIVFGATGFTGDILGDFTPFNSAFLMDPDGLTGFQYDKRYLVPFVERFQFCPIPGSQDFLTLADSVLAWLASSGGQW